MSLRGAAATALLLCCAPLSTSGAPLSLTAGGKLTLTLDPSTLAYKIGIGGAEWFDSGGEGGEGGFAYSADGKTVSHASGGMKPVGAPKQGSGSDTSGAFTSITIGFSRSGGGAAEWVATFKAYTNRTALAFEQHWPVAQPRSTGGSVFPALRKTSAEDLGTLEYTGSSCGFMVGAKGSFPGIQGGPSKGYVVIAPKDTSGAGAAATFAVGPVTEHCKIVMLSRFVALFVSLIQKASLFQLPIRARTAATRSTTAWPRLLLSSPPATPSRRSSSRRWTAAPPTPCPPTRRPPCRPAASTRPCSSTATSCCRGTGSSGRSATTRPRPSTSATPPPPSTSVRPAYACATAL